MFKEKSKIVAYHSGY